MSFFRKKIIGLDIADRSIEVVELTKKGVHTVVSSIARAQLYSGVVERGKIVDAKELALALKALFENAKPHSLSHEDIVFGLPTSLVYSHVFSIGEHAIEDREKLITEEAESHIPLPKDDLLFAYQIMDEKEDRTEILLVAISKSAFIMWQDFFVRENIKISLFDIEDLAVHRGLFIQSPHTPVCIVDVGSITTNINIFDNNKLRYSRSITIAGEAMTEEVSRALATEDLDEAENMKKATGLSKPAEKVSTALVKVLEQIAKEIQVALSYTYSQTSTSVNEILLVGGGSLLLGIPEYFRANLNISVHLGSPVIGLGNNAGQRYIESIGLALRLLDSKWENQPTFSYTPQKSALHIGVEARVHDGNWLTLHHKEAVLLVVLLISALLLPVAFWYRGSTQAKKEAYLQSQLELLDAIVPFSPENTVVSEQEDQDIIVEEPEEPIESVRITETPTGWLNVRKGPGISYEKITTLSPGETYVLLKEEDGWYNIELEEGEEGWIISEFAERFSD